MNPDHANFLTDEALRARRAADIPFGRSTIHTFSIRRDEFASRLGPPTDLNLASAFGAPPTDPERQRLDAHCRGILNRLQHGLQKQPLTLSFSLSPQLSVAIDTGYGGSEPNYLLLLGRQGYRVTASTSERFILYPDSDLVVLEVSPTEGGLHGHPVPSLEELTRLQGTTGEQLRAALGAFSEFLSRRASELMESLRRLEPTATMPTMVVNIPDPAHTRVVEARFSLSPNSLIERFELVAPR